MLTVLMFDFLLGYPVALPMRLQGKEAVKSTRQQKVFENSPVKDLHTAVDIMQAHPSKTPRQVIENPGSIDLEEIIFSFTPPPHHEVVALLKLLDQPGELRRVILEVTVQCRDKTASGPPEAGAQSL